MKSALSDAEVKLKSTSRVPLRKMRLWPKSIRSSRLVAHRSVPLRSRFPKGDEPKDLKGAKTRAELVHCYRVVVDDGMVNAEANFANAIAQLRILNSKVTLQTEGFNFAYNVPLI